ncbi:hypothetical protein HID58_061137 [Brassica napus]|uniref:Uncharacterized protein n=1 Tax=Brassica napus TaxID=3708 RepID=A0ABQ7ZXR3_BRANA|nr:hypothetical protein HID58_061137 [Brassica napus]
MEDYERNSNSPAHEEDSDVRKGPWTEEEDAILVNFVSIHGDARWNHIARSSGLKRTGKSCRLRWLNYLRPDVRRGNITLEEQLMILKLHSL